jgi:GNAT superfamily N-acetyltransferase
MSDEQSHASISTDHELLDVSWMVRSIQSSYWGGVFPDEMLSRAIANSLVFGAYRDGKQIGFVRVLTDHGVFSSVTDVFVDEAHRGKGVGSALMKAVVEHESVAKTYCILRARPEAWLWYFKADFHVFDRKSGLMQRMPR